MTLSYLLNIEKGLGNDNNGKSLIQEIEQPSQSETKKQQPAPKEESHVQALPQKIEYKVQETSENYFFIFNLPNYDKTNVTAAFYDNQVNCPSPTPLLTLRNTGLVKVHRH